MEQSIKIKALCLFVHEGKALVGKHSHPSVGEFYRVLGGTVEYRETTEVAVRRELMEELGTDIERLEFLEVEENIFPYAGEVRHEIDFLYKGELANKELHAQPQVAILDHDGYAVWVPCDELKAHPHFFPGGYKKYL